MKQLSDIMYGVRLVSVKGPSNAKISTVTFDSRAVQAESLFIATRGTQVDGHQFIDQAIEKGAIAIVCEEFPKKLNKDVSYFKVSDSSHSLGIIAGNFYDNPSRKLKLIGITGTNGKTTTATLLFDTFREIGYKCGLLSTVENRVNENLIPSSHTTPDALSLNKLLADMVAQTCDYCFMEVSSHAIVQQRIAGLDFSGGIFTNITHDHLDFHHTFDEYIKAKKMFFDQLNVHAFALTNVDDKRGMVMLQNTKAHKKTYSLQSMADFKARVQECQFSGMLLTIDEQEVWFKLIGRFNAYNLLAVFATAMLLDQDKMRVLTVLSRMKGAEGRFETFVAPNKVVGIVDYAHTPDAVQNVLSTIDDIRSGSGKIITVIGCGGDRDAAKRPLMAKVACEWSDKVILTADNPRSEDAQEIITEMEKGVAIVDRKKTLSIVDRREAIRTACHLAQAGDIILVAGKGHEKYQEIKGVKYPFDDKEVLNEMFKDLK